MFASAAAKYENPSMTNYHGGQERAARGHVDKIVPTYLTVRTNLSISSIIRSPYAYLSVNEKVARGAPNGTGITTEMVQSHEMPPLQARQHQETTIPSPSNALTPYRQ
jgi:hypothetical protein